MQNHKYCSRFAELDWVRRVREQDEAYSQAVAVVMQVMKVVNDLIKVPELNQTMQQMSKEMMKAGLIEETMGEMMDDVFDTDDIEEDADAEVDKVRMQTEVLHVTVRHCSNLLHHVTVMHDAEFVKTMCALV